VTFDVDAAGMDSFVESAVDESGWTGIQFWAKSLLGYPRTVNVFVNDDRTDPWGGRVDAGGCDVCANYAGTMGFCGDGPRASVVFTPGWTHLQLPFTSMHPVGIYGSSGNGVGRNCRVEVEAPAVEVDGVHEVVLVAVPEGSLFDGLDG
jgi:hypothetical protein